MRRLKCKCLLLAMFVANLSTACNLAKAQNAELVPPTSFFAGEVKNAAPDSAASCDPVCTTYCADYHLIFNAEAVWLAPQQHGLGLSYFAITDRNRDVVEDVSNSSAELNGFYVTPRLTLGVQGECWGLQARYWRMDESHTGYDIVSPQYNTGYFAQNSLKAETADLEVTRLFCLRETDFCASFGVRYAEMRRAEMLSATDLVNNEIFTGYARAQHNISGPGITGALIGKRPIGCKNFNLFCGLRASVVWDNDLANETETNAIVLNRNNGHYANTSTYDRTTADSSVFIGELQVGGQWDFDLRCLRAKAFVRAAFEYQYWKDTNTGLAAGTSIVSADSRQLYGKAMAISSDSEVDLIGFNIATGLTW
jgi:hypothetical protein